MTDERTVLFGVATLSILLAVVFASMWLVQRERDFWLEDSYRTCSIGLATASAKVEAYREVFATARERGIQAIGPEAMTTTWILLLSPWLCDGDSLTVTASDGRTAWAFTEIVPAVAAVMMCGVVRS